MKKLLVFLCAMFFAFPVMAACTSDEIDVLGDGSQCETAKFTLTTVTSTTTFQFLLSAKGTFYVDCGNGGTLTSGSATDYPANGKIVNHTYGTDAITYTCTWGTGAVQTIRFGGTATDYSTSSAIRFNPRGSKSDTNAPKVASITGNLSEMFPYKTANAQKGAQPRFYYAFMSASLTSIPETLFANYTTPATGMFNSTFSGCTGLTSIPEDLFSNISGAATGMFTSTFSGCTGLTTIPEDLFAGISGVAPGMFYGTFSDCTGLTSIPEGLFSNISGAASDMFNRTFINCTGLTSIPANLFAGVPRSAGGMFDSTFSGCTNLASITDGQAGTSYVPGNFISAVADGTSTKSASNMFTNTALAATCPVGTRNDTPAQFDNAGKPWCSTGFKITTTSTDSFQFKMSATGTFTVDCRDGGTLTSTASDVTNNKTITRSGTTEVTYTCSWGGVTSAHTITFDGTATYYSTNASTAAIRFNIAGNDSDTNAPKLASISGLLGQVFPVANGRIPRFYYTFRGCSNLTSIPAELFSAIDTSSATNTSYVFAGTFYGCTNLTSIPAELFSGIDTSSATNTSSMFASTFYGCSNLTSIPAELFSGIDTSSATNTTSMFQSTFYGCTNLTSIPAELFSGIDTSSATNTSAMFNNTFGDCTNLTSIPAELFSTIDASAATNTNHMFDATFRNCSNLTSIPAELFSGIDTSSATNTGYMFYSTFSGCSNLTSIPAELFSAIDTSSATNTSYMFAGTFSGCSNLTSIPAELFSGIDTSSSTNTSYMFQSTFSGCAGLTGAIPSGLFIGIDTSSATNTSYMFQSTFYNCGGLTGAIPSGLFSGIDTSSATNTSYMFATTFSGCSKLTSIPAELFSGIDTSSATSTIYMFYYTFSRCTGLTSITNGQTSTTYVPGSFLSNITSTDTNIAINMFTSTALAATCPVGTHTDSKSQSGGLFANAGKPWCALCTAEDYSIKACYPHIFHVGDDIMYMKWIKQTTPSLNIQIGNDIFYINMTTTRTRMNKDSAHYFHVDWDNNHYYVCDDTMCPDAE